MKRLLHISPNEFPKLSVNHATKKIWCELAKDFDQYHILARSKDNRFHTYKEGNIFLHLVPNLSKSRSFFFTSLYMIKIIRKYNINTILSQCPLVGGFIATLISKATKIPLMVEIHGMEYFRVLDSNKVYNRIIAKMIRYSFANAKKVRSLSKKMTDMLIERNVEANIVEIPNRVNCKLFNKPKCNNSLNQRIKVVSVGRFVWEKAYDIAIKAIIELQQKYDLELTLIGGGPLLDEYKKLVKDHKNINFVTWVPQEKFVPILNQSDIYIQPSISEGMPRTILEAMALRLPVIVSDVGAISGIINNKINGLLIEPGKIESLIEAIEELISNPQLRKDIANNGYENATTKYEWNVVFEKYRSELINMK
ncbi:glycosyltransferase family 4 protein [Domibacillus sp. DTU_2020_1001157_1_SI_ALB_TIR_016]|uniref:glycosyltransferase family 4 protein n=1 Tax=Domibacillus sp. DTU_2020_1001157_1_SI_ALB_TIR_016 TaxID=3077789 RepID=UPI0028EAEE24|nr:glycosyltransferase family 4 protein [Domibacillus sp. DTU_2020_1001157_1_SI_ALB_TIR_016]WNS81185.1 glycosyltransferase family 4 protein [Domibacillus sp. DTU_2020_1001157_1_SI_ALB_TIR_016]